MLADLYEYRSQVAQLVCTCPRADAMLRPVGCKGLQVFAADLRSRLNSITLLTHGPSKRIEGLIPHFSPAPEFWMMAGKRHSGYWLSSRAFNR